MGRWLLLAFVLAACATPVYICYPAMTQTPEGPTTVLVCSPARTEP